jgi:hypothetical protein
VYDGYAECEEHPVEPESNVKPLPADGPWWVLVIDRASGTNAERPLYVRKGEDIDRSVTSVRANYPLQFVTYCSAEL